MGSAPETLGRCDAGVERGRADYILGYVDSLGRKWPDAKAFHRAVLRLRSAIMFSPLANGRKGLWQTTAAAALALALTSAAQADPALIELAHGAAPIPGYTGSRPLAADSPAIVQVPVQFTATELGLQSRNGVEPFDFGLTAAEQAMSNGTATPASSGFLAGLSSTFGCTAGAVKTCGPSGAVSGSFFGIAQSAIATPLPGALFLFGSVLLGGLGMSARRVRRRNRGAVSLLA